MGLGLRQEQESECFRPGAWLTPGRLIAGITFSAILFALGWLATHTAEPAQAESRRTEVGGYVRDSNGKPIANAWVTDGETYEFTDERGMFVFDGGKVVPGSSLIASSSGYKQQVVVAPNNGEHVQIVMSDSSVRGIYFNPLISNNPESIENYIHIAKTTEVNAVVIDVKENYVYFDTDNRIFQGAGMVLPIMDLPAIIDEFHDNGIYVIARIVVFKDSAIAQQYPQYAVTDSLTGKLWYDQSGSAWVNPLNRTMWDANIDLAEEVIKLGFDEVQYDYIRFPTDGNMARAWFGTDYTPEAREAAIEDFLAMSRERIIPLGGRQSADVFGYTTVIEGDLGIGQNFDEMAGSLDYISPMIYPSHWPEGSLYGIPGHPNEYPYLTVQISMSSAKDQLAGNGRQLRPWLQDFGVRGQRAYGVDDVKAQLQALKDLGINSWLIWSPTNWYHVAAFEEDQSQDVVPTAEPVPVNQPSSSHDRRRYRIAS